MAASVRSWWSGHFDAWLRRRAPRRRALTLNQRRIFILPTRHGVYFLLTLGAIFVGGINYGNSLILATAFLLVSLFLVSILHTYANLAGLRVAAGRSEPAFAGDEAAFELILSSFRRRPHESLYLHWGQAPARVVDRVAEAPVAVRMLLPVTRRGRFRPPRLKLETVFPLGLLRAWSWLELDMACLVYPKPEACTLPRRPDSRGEEGEVRRHDGSDDFDGLRRYQTGDNPRHLAWKQYARSGELHAKAFVGHETHELWLEWEAFAGQGVETRLARLCYWVLKLSERGRSFGLRLPGETLAPDSGAAHERRCLQMLALYGEKP
ncbi:DUF58 domain-containing protein [Motiliproteus sp. SC1-56]|uniref:DUF58 domain-containing protein n=1 Tax=Motiliproteus sp. SC1-56 TaxID=2799565 RepID=UPI001A8D99B5|nr:DUF58 domain-containing protein [Motiliproteus sp. SC1-56]